jgi:glycerol-3-phosphate dehydrogenase (NAD(P)+)
MTTDVSTAPVIAILGAGAWGTAFALHLARAKPHAKVILWGREAAQMRDIADRRENARYLPGVALPPALTLTADLNDAVRDATLIIAATPVAGLVALAEQCAASVRADVPFFWLSKGFLIQDDEIALAHEKIQPIWRAPCGVISGPSFAQEVAANLPTALVVAGTDKAAVNRVAATVRSETLRVYPNDDLVGVETGGAMKNVLAIATGICDGLKFGHNARAAIMTRGLVEMTRFADALGGIQPSAVNGLAGLGDLILTCTGDLSRNRRVGLLLAEGLSLTDVLQKLGHVAEGVPAAFAADRLARKLGVDLPIADAVAQILAEKISPKAAAQMLLSRSPKDEN